MGLNLPLDMATGAVITGSYCTGACLVGNDGLAQKPVDIAHEYAAGGPDVVNTVVLSASRAVNLPRDQVAEGLPALRLVAGTDHPALPGRELALQPAVHADAVAMQSPTVKPPGPEGPEIG